MTMTVVQEQKLLNTRPRGFSAVGIYRSKTWGNVGTLLRTAAAFDASFVFCIGARWPVQNSALRLERHLPVFHFEDMAQLRASAPENAEVVFVEIGAKARKLEAFTHPERALVHPRSRGLGHPAGRDGHSSSSPRCPASRSALPERRNGRVNRPVRPLDQVMSPTGRWSMRASKATWRKRAEVLLWVVPGLSPWIGEVHARRWRGHTLKASRTDEADLRRIKSGVRRGTDT